MDFGFPLLVSYKGKIYFSYNCIIYKYDENWNAVRIAGYSNGCGEANIKPSSPLLDEILNFDRFTIYQDEVYVLGYCIFKFKLDDSTQLGWPVIVMIEVM